MIPTAPAAILYDHDGTVVDSLAVVVRATNEVLIAAGLPPAEPAAIVAAMVLPTAPRLGHHAAITDPLIRQRMAQDFYAATHRVPHLASAYPGIADLLAAIHRSGLPQGLVSNNQGGFIRRVTSALGLAPYLAIQIGEEDMPAPKPDPRGLLLAAHHLGVAPSQCWFVGDSGPDAQAAKAAGMRSIGVTWGTHTRAELAHLGFDCLIDHPKEILFLAGLDAK